MNSTYPIVKIDRTTITEILPIFINKGIFSNYDDLPERADLLNKHKENLVYLSLRKNRKENAYLKLANIKPTNMLFVIMVVI